MRKKIGEWVQGAGCRVLTVLVGDRAKSEDGRAGKRRKQQCPNSRRMSHGEERIG